MKNGKWGFSIFGKSSPRLLEERQRNEIRNSPSFEPWPFDSELRQITSPPGSPRWKIQKFLILGGMGVGSCSVLEPN